ncbi:MAG: hypothetical protein U0587_08580 [Candidatus Binatia bacterium]
MKFWTAKAILAAVLVLGLIEPVYAAPGGGGRSAGRAAGPSGAAGMRGGGPGGVRGTGGGWHGSAPGGASRAGGSWHGGASSGHGGGSWYGHGGYHGHGSYYGHGGHYGHGGWYGGHGGWYGGVYVGVPWWGPFYPYPGWYASDYYYSSPPVVLQEAPSVYIQQEPAPAAAPAQSNWYYCPNPKGYYPEVGKCREAWIRVPQPPG